VAGEGHGREVTGRWRSIGGLEGERHPGARADRAGHEGVLCLGDRQEDQRFTAGGYRRIIDPLLHGHLRRFRLPIAFILIPGGVLSTLPIFGIWMLPLGLLLLDRRTAAATVRLKPDDPRQAPRRRLAAPPRQRLSERLTLVQTSGSALV
jgi:hypothetical protein